MFDLLPNLFPSLDPSTPEEPPPIVLQTKVKRGSEEGYECVSCDDFHPQAELNVPQAEPQIFECYLCRRELRSYF